MVGFRLPSEEQSTSHIGGPTRSRRWADLDDGSEECEEDSVPMVPPVVDDSYREAPVSCLEDSRGGLNERLTGAAGLGEQPRDFTFFFQGANGGAREPPPLQEETPSKDRSLSRPASWRPNVNAPEFIPTLTMQCPFIGICHTVSGTAFADSSTFTPEKGRAPSPTSRAGRSRHSAKKRRTSTAQAAPRTPRPVSMPSEDATEEDWQRRAEMRQKAIDMVKKFPEYRWYSEAKREGDPPLTPDPRDRGISKRRWKYLTAQWRLALKQRYIEDGHGSVAGTEEWATSISTEDTEGFRVLDGDDGQGG